MSSQFEKSYRVTPSSVLSANLWNSVFQNIDQRLIGIEDKKASFEAAEQQLLEVGLRRINETIGPAAEKIVQLSELGFLVASSQALLKPVDGQVLSVHLIKGVRTELFAPSPFIALVRRSTPDDYAIGRLLYYERDTARVDMAIVAVQGDMGPHDDWDVAALAGSVKAMWDALAQSRSIRDEVQTKHADVVQKSADVVQKHGETVAKHADFVSIWYGARTAPPEEAKTGAMYLDVAQNPAVVMVKSGDGWIMAAIASDNVYTRAQANAKFLTQENAQFLSLSGGTVTGGIALSGGQYPFYNVSIPDGANHGGGLAMVPQPNTGGKRSEVSYLAGGGVRIWIEGEGNVATFAPNGQARFSNYVHAGDAFLGTDGNINGSIWEQWGNKWAFDAIGDHIEARINARCVTDTRFAGYSNGVPSGYVVVSVTAHTGYVSGSNGQAVQYVIVNSRQPQIYIPDIGWRAFGSW